MNFKEEDFKYEYFKGSGPGGQHRNKVISAVKVTHIPTGPQEKCEDTRSNLES